MKVNSREPNREPIHIKKENKGKFHEVTHTPKGQKIPEAKIKAEEKSPDKAVRKEAQFADNAKKFDHSGGGKKK